MKILFVSGNPHLPQVVGGVEINTHELVNELIARGHNAAVLAKLSWRDWYGLSRAPSYLASRKFTCDRHLGYPVFRSRSIRKSITSLPRYDIAVIQEGDMLGFAGAFAEIGVPTVAYFHSLPFENWNEQQRASDAPLPFHGYLAVSQFVARRFHQLCGIDAIVIPPFFRRERYVTCTTRQVVTFINPVPLKGLELALDIAALCPTIPFHFIRAWPLGLRPAVHLRRRLRHLPNVILRGRTSDMRSVYKDTKVLLVPSQVETWGRVVSEAQFSGIPVVASNRGGLPESIGLGGVMVGGDCPPAVWADAIRNLWNNDDLYWELSRAALRHIARSTLAPNRQIEFLLSALYRFGARDMRSARHSAS